MKEQKTTKWSNFNPLCLARHVLRNLWMTVLAGLICVMAVYLLQTLVSKPSYDSQVTFARDEPQRLRHGLRQHRRDGLRGKPVRRAAAEQSRPHRRCRRNGPERFPGTCSSMCRRTRTSSF